jgi:phosphoglycolate phosphatase
MNSAYKHIIFDLDGTLSDSREGIFNAYYYTFNKLNISSPDENTLMNLIGPPLQKGFADAFGLQGAENESAVKVFREYYSTKGLFENKLYDGINDLLDQLVQAGASLYVATSKYNVYANQVLQYFGIANCFTEVAGADYGGYHASKVDLVAGILRRNNIRDPMEAVIIGDTRYDIDAAAELGIDSIGVTYGFSSFEDIESFDPDYIVENVEALQSLLLNGEVSSGS